MKTGGFLASCILSIALPVAGLSTAHAVAPTYSFDVIYGGSNAASLAAGSDDPTGVTLQNGDSFLYRLRAQGNGQWTSTGGSIFPLFSLEGPFGSSTADFTLNLKNNGVVLFSYSEVGANTCCAHLGTNTVSIPALVFDEFELLDSIISTSATGPTNSLLPWPGVGPENHSPNILSFQADGTTVPEPGSLALMFAGLGLAEIVRRRRKAQA